jgi:hypothetical protein
VQSPQKKGRCTDLADDVRRALHLLVQHDCDALADVRTRLPLENATAAPIELEVHHRLVELLVASRARVGERAATHEGILLQHVERVVELGAPSLRGLAPGQRDVARHHTLHFRQREVLLDLLAISIGDEELAILPRLRQQSAQWAIALVGREGGRSRTVLPRAITRRQVAGACGIPTGPRGAVTLLLEEQIHRRRTGRPLRGVRRRGGRCHLAGRHDRPIDARQRVHQFRRRQDVLELEERRALDDRLRALLVTNARKRHDDAVITRLLNQRLEHAELVDAVENHLQRLVGSIAARLGRHRALRIAHLEGEVHAALQVETEGDAFGNQESDGCRYDRDDDEDSAFQRAEHEQLSPKRTVWNERRGVEPRVRTRRLSWRHTEGLSIRAGQFPR